MRTTTASLLVVILSAILSSTCLAWNGEGHQIIAWIAEERLTDKAKAGVKELLGDAALSDAEIASWADQIRRERRKTAPWHYVNIPVESNGYDPKRDGNGGENVIDVIERFTKVVSDKKADKEQRVEALKFLVHFVGDLHQPLHCADRNKDKGGNSCLVFFPGQRKATNLHTVWDTFMLRSRKQKQSVAEYATKLNDGIGEEQAKSWVKGTPLDWATEAWRIAKQKVYPPVPADGSVPTLTSEYVAEGGTIVDEQLQKAGVRLVSLLNAAFR